jgi:hypothetical protein
MHLEMNMNCNTAQSAVSPSASELFGAAWNSAVAGVETLWQDHVARTRQARAMATFAEIDAHTLRDIGAPNWIVAEATMRGDSRGLRLIDLYRS